jgi:cobalt/nickel transport system permease protein
VTEGDEKTPAPSRLSPGRVAGGFIVVAVLLTPLGLLAPGGAFGEDAPGELDLAKYDLNRVPAGLEKYNSFWDHAVLGGYGFSNGEHANLAYILSAVAGIAVVGAVIFAIGKIVQAVSRTRDSDPSNGELVHQP